MAQKIDIKTVDEIAHLARLEFNDEAKGEIVNDMNRMLAFIDKLSELDTDSVEPLIYMTDEKNVLREDEAKQTITQAEALKNAPKKDSDYFKVPKVIDQSDHA
jgi:aspartyl-tRNA(Asn)/glutamyl-tRNA(Gln) amidotransferase subunit C